MNAPSSRPPDERFAEWVDGCMSQRDRERFEAELRVNATLRAELATYERTVATLREALQAPTAPTALAERVLAAVQASSVVVPSPPGSRPRRSFGAYLFGGLAAAALMGMAVWFDAWVTPTREIDKAAQVDRDGLATPPSGSAPVAGSKGRSDVPTAEQEEKEVDAGDLLRHRTDAKKVAAEQAKDAESEKSPGQAHDDAGRDKRDGDTKAKEQDGTFGAPESLVTAGLEPEEQAPRPDAAGGEIPGREVVAPAPTSAVPVASAPPGPGGAVRRLPEGTGAAPGDPGAAKPEAVGVVRDQAEPAPTPPGAPAGGRGAPSSSESSPGSRSAPAPSPVPSSPFVGPLPLLTVERSATPAAVPPLASAGSSAKGDESLARFAEAAQADLPRLADQFLATAGAGTSGEIVWRTARGSLVLRAIDPDLVAPPGERADRRADSATRSGGGGASAIPLPAPCAWLVVGDPADIEVLLARLGAKVRAEGWKLQAGEFDGPKARQNSATVGLAGPATGPATAQRSLLLLFRFRR